MSKMQLTSASGYDTSRLIFSDPIVSTIPDSKPAITYRRINIQTRHMDGTFGDLIIPTSELYSFGVQEELNPETGKLNGYKMPFCLWHRNGPPTDEQKEWYETFNRIVDCCKTHLIENREEIEQYELEMNDLKTFNPIYIKKEKGRVVEGTAPVLKTKLIESKKLNKILTMFFDYDGNSLDPRGDILGKHCNARAAVKIDSIFIGGVNKISLQVKLYECELSLVQSGMKRLLPPRPKSVEQVITETNSSNPPLNHHSDDEAGSLAGSDTEETKTVQHVIKPAIVKKIKKVVRKSESKNEE